MMIERFVNIINSKNFIGYLQPVYNSQKSFYRKAVLYQKYDNILKKELIYLLSYNTIVAIIDAEENGFFIFGYYSQTTARHINDFLYQYGFKTYNKKDILKLANTWQYIPKEKTASELDTLDIILGLEGGRVKVETIEDLQAVMNVCKTLASSQGFYGRLLESLQPLKENFNKFTTPFYL